MSMSRAVAVLSMVALVGASASAGATESNLPSGAPAAVPGPLVDSMPGLPGKTPAWRWALPGGALILGAASLGFGIHFLNTSGPPSCDAPVANCTHGMTNSMKGTDLTAAGAFLLFGATVDLVRLWGLHKERVLLGLIPGHLFLGGRF